MAKSKTRKKAAEKKYYQELQFRMISLLLLFLCIVGVMELGPIGNLINSCIIYLVGNLYGIVYMTLFFNFSYILFKAELPNYSGPRAVGFYLLFIAVITAASLPTEKKLVGMDSLELALNATGIYKGGFFGCLFYAVLSTLFAYTGAIIASFFIGALGLGLLIGKTLYAYFKEGFRFDFSLFEEKDKENDGSKKKKKKEEQVTSNTKEEKIKKKTSLFSKKKKTYFFPEKSFSDESKDDEEFESKLPNIIMSERKDEEYHETIVSPYGSSKEIIDVLNQDGWLDIDAENENFEVIDASFQQDYDKDASKETLIDAINQQLSGVNIAKTVDTKEATTNKTQTIRPPKKINIQVAEYKIPPISLLSRPEGNKTSRNTAQKLALQKADELISVLQQFGVNTAVQDIFIGPAVTKFELKLETGTRVNKIMSLQDDIKLALAAKDIRIEAPIPGKSVVGVEIPNNESTMVTFREVLEDIPKSKQNSKLLVPLGKDVTGLSVFAELDKMPHLLIAGATGSGKSVCVNSIICSILMRCTPKEVKLVLVDPKKVELSSYNNIPHLLTPVVTDPKEANEALKRIVEEMERRYELIARENVRNITGYNETIRLYNEGIEEEALKKEILPFIVVILDEVADLMMVASKEVEDSIMRLAQMARAAGIHLIVATQRPSTDVITGVVKANIPSRIAFAVSSAIDSRTILDTSGAEKLLGRGDMLFAPMGASAPIRVQGSFVSDEEVGKITYYTIKQQQVTYDPKFSNLKSTTVSSGKSDGEDEEYEMCRDFVIQEQKASASLLQRRFRIGYNKAARIIDQLEENGIIGPQLGSKPREVLIRKYEEEY